MEQKPFHYDGSVQIDHEFLKDLTDDSIEITDEVRKNIATNPYTTVTNE